MKNLYPAYHFRPEKNWMNDPNGLIYFEGRYHLFYQHNPYSDKWGTIHWGHAVSTDLIHWEHLPLALYPSNEDGEVHCYSGCAVAKDGVPYLFYTSVGAGNRGPEKGAQQWSAVSHDGMLTWEKYGRPAIPEELHGIGEVEMWRDPFLWQEDCWYAVLSGTRQGKGCLLLYRSRDLEHWEYLNRIYDSDEYWLIECPNMIPLGNSRYLILYSPLDAVRYMVAELDKKSWELDILKEGIFDHSILKHGFYSPNTYLNDPKGRKVIIGWLAEADRENLTCVSGWAGIQSIPREVSVNTDGELSVKPVEEYLSLRQECLCSLHNCTKDTDFAGSDMKENAKIAVSDTAEILLRAHADSSSSFVLRFFADEEGREETRLGFDGASGKLVLDRSRSSLYDEVDKTEISCHIDSAEPDLHIFLDRSSVEIFVCGHTTMTARVFPSLDQSCGIYLERQGNVELKELEIWQLS